MPLNKQKRYQANQDSPAGPSLNTSSKTQIIHSTQIGTSDNPIRIPVSIRRIKPTPFRTRETQRRRTAFDEGMADILTR